MMQDALALWRKVRSHSAKGTSLYLRLFAFFALFVTALMAAVLLFLNFGGFLNRGNSRNQVWFANELEHFSQDVEKDLGELSIQGVTMAEQLAKVLESGLKEGGGAPQELHSRPELLEPLLKEQMAVLLPALQNQKCGGAFVILDASVRPAEGDGRRAGIFLKRTIPNAVRTISSKLYYLRGPAAIARESGIELLGQWQMEFLEEETDFFATVTETARKYPELPLSRLYYWTPRVLLSGNSEAGMLLCIPLISSDGTVMGVCGFEVSAMLFKQTYSPDNTTYTRVFSVLAPAREQSVQTAEGLLAGNFYLNSAMGGDMSVQEGPLNWYLDQNRAYYGGLHQSVGLYPADSPYRGEVWLAAVMAPLEDVKAVSQEGVRLFQIGMLVISVASLCAAAFISRRYIAPVVRTLKGIKEGEDYAALPKTRYLEINDLLEFLTAQDEAVSAALAEAESRASVTGEEDVAEVVPAVDPERFRRFLECLKTLSPAEQRVFDLYVQEYKAKDIAAKLHLSRNTVKFHNGNIYSKLEVGSRKELLTYIRHMRSCQKKEESPHGREPCSQAESYY